MTGVDIFMIKNPNLKKNWGGGWGAGETGEGGRCDVGQQQKEVR